ncbi:MAG: hypothetical protein ACRDZ7_05275 [Acidimicrobiia bacterium]
MTLLETVSLAAVGVWLLILTAVALLGVRQLGILTVRLQLQAHGGPGGPIGPTIGFKVGDAAVRALPGLATERKMMVLLSANCSPCQEILDELQRGTRPRGFADDEIVLLITGDPRTSEAQAAQITGVTSLLDPVATALGRDLGLSRTPSAILIEDGTVKGTTLLASVENMEHLLHGDEILLPTPPMVNA